MEARLVTQLQTIQTTITTKIDKLDTSFREHVKGRIKKSEKNMDKRIDECWEQNQESFKKMDSRIHALSVAAETEVARHRLALTQALRKHHVFVGNLSPDMTLDELKTLATTILEGTNKKFKKMRAAFEVG